MGLVGLMNTLKLEGSKYDIRVNTVAPMAVTRLTEDVLPPGLAEQLTPELVVPLVLYLCSEQCADSGLILNAGMGYYGRAAVVSAPGVALGEGEQVPTLEDIHRNWDRIDSLAGAQAYDDANAALMAMLAGPRPSVPSPQPSVPSQEVGSGGLATVQGVFDRLPDAFQPGAAAGVDVVFQFSISGPGGGDWYAVVKNDICTVEACVHGKPTTTLKMSDEDFLKYVGGQLPAMQAYTSGRLRIEGDLMKSQLIEKLFKF
jgi:putative sterol carrier protein